MKVFGIHIIDLIVVFVYFFIILYIGVFIGSKKTKNLGDFFIAGSKWGGLVTFIFVFASSLAGNEAVVVSGKSYEVGLSGVWYWWGFLFATPVYYLFSTYYRRARVYNLAEFFELRFGRNAAALYSILASLVTIFFMGIILLAVGKILAGITMFPLQLCIWSMVMIVSAYVFSGGMMSALITNILQGLIIITALGFILLPFIWKDAGGMNALRNLPKSTWDFTSEGMPFINVTALNVSAIIGGIAGPWMLPWLAVSKNEYAARQCAWGHLGKRIATLVFTLYGIFFAISLPGLSDPESSFGLAVSKVIPEGYGLIGIIIAGFFAAGMSSIDSYATTSSSMAIDFFYRKIIAPGKKNNHYFRRSRYWAVFSILLAAVSTLFINSLAEYVKIWLSLLSFLGVPIFFGIIWRKANRRGLWLAFGSGSISYLLINFLLTGEGRLFENSDLALPYSIFIPTGLAIAFMFWGSLKGDPESNILLNKFYLIMYTPVGKESRLIDAGISLPALTDTPEIKIRKHILKPEVINKYYFEGAENKIFGADSKIELRREPENHGYFSGFIKITLACIFLIIFTWLLTRILFVW